MRRAALLLVAVSACSDGGSAELIDAGPDAMTVEPDLGGTLALAACGYSVTTRNGATAPRPIADGSAPLGPGPAPRQVHLGLAADPARSMVVLWRTEDDSTLATTVRFGKASTAERSVDGFTFRYGTPRIHEVHLCGLEPDTEYVYQAGGRGQGGEAWSPERRFRTAPDAADPSAQVTVAVLGDARGGQAVWASALAKAEELGGPDVILFTGDAVTVGFLDNEWNSFFGDAEAVLARIPSVFTNGNHEGNAVGFYSQVAQPGNEEWFGLDYGPFHLVNLNDSPVEVASIAGEQRDFLDRDLAAHASARWKLVMHHRSMWSSAAVHGSAFEVRGAWGPIVDKHHVDLVLSGHDHNYERSVPMLGDGPAAQGQAGTVYVVSGGAGAPLYENGKGPSTAFSSSVEHFVLLQIRAGSLEGRAYRVDGSPLDSFSLIR